MKRVCGHACVDRDSVYVYCGTRVGRELPKILLRFSSSRKLQSTVLLLPRLVITQSVTPVSYTHLDVYKRQI